MPTLKLRQDITRSLPYVGANGKHQCIYWDSALECFGLRVYPSGRRTFVYSYWVHRRKRLGTLGRADVLTLEEARRKAKALLGQVASQQDPQDNKDQLRKAVTIKKLVEAYIENHAKPKKRSWKQDQSFLQRLLLPALGTRLAINVTTADIQQIHTREGSSTSWHRAQLPDHRAQDVQLGAHGWTPAEGAHKPRGRHYRISEAQTPPVPNDGRNAALHPGARARGQRVRETRLVVTATDWTAHARTVEGQMGRHRLGCRHAVRRPDKER